MRSRRETITFKHPFRIKGIDRLLPAGAYEVITHEEMIEGLSFAVFRRVATMIHGAGGKRRAVQRWRWFPSVRSIYPMPSALTRARLVSDKQLDLDKHRGMAEQKATDIRPVGRRE